MMKRYMLLFANIMKSQFMRFLTGSMLIVSLLAAGRPGMVLCIGDDGHLAMEPEHHGHCGSEHSATDTKDDGAALWDASATACETCGCVDLPLGSDKLLHASKLLTKDRLKKCGAGQFFLLGYAPFAQIDVHGCLRPVHGARPIPAQSLLEKRTIVLLI